MIVKKILMMLLLGSLLAFLACEQEPEEEDASLLGIWEMDSMVSLDSEGEVDEDGNSMDFPLDWIAMLSKEMGNTTVDYDLDSDGSDESVVFSVFIEVTAERMRMYGKVAITDPGNPLSDFLTANQMDPTQMGLPFFETGLKYNSDDDISGYTVDGNTLTGLSQSGSATFTIDGDTLVITAPEGDGFMKLTLTKGTSTDIEGATNDTTISIFGGGGDE